MPNDQGEMIDHFDGREVSYGSSLCLWGTMLQWMESDCERDNIWVSVNQES
jgi:hypothetical protein